MAVLFLIFWIRSVKNGSNFDQVGSSWISHPSEYVIIVHCHIYRKDGNDCFVFVFFWIRPVQNGLTVHSDYLK